MIKDREDKIKEIVELLHKLNEIKNYESYLELGSVVYQRYMDTSYYINSNGIYYE